MSHRIDGDIIHIFNERGTMSMDRADAAAIVALGVAGSGVAQNLDLIFRTIQGMKAEIGELQLQVQKLETGARDDEREGPGPSERAFAAKHEEAPKPLSERVVGPGDNAYGRKVTMSPALGAPYSGTRIPLTCTRLTATWADGGWRTPAATLDTPLNTPAADGWCCLAWPNRAQVLVARGRLHARVGDRVVDLDPASGPVYIPPIQRFLLEPLTAECELCIDWHHAPAPEQIPRDAAVKKAAVKKAASKQSPADAVLVYLSQQVRELGDRAAESYKKEGKSSRTMRLDDEAEIVTRISDDIRRILNHY